MNALAIGILCFLLTALGVVCPHEWVYVPALLITIFAGGFSGGVIFSMQSEGVYELKILSARLPSSDTGVVLGGVWTYGLIGIAAGVVGLLVVARIVGIDASGLAHALTGGANAIEEAIRRLTVCVALFAVTVVAGFLGINLIRMLSDRLKEEIQKNVKQEVEDQVSPMKLLGKGELLLKNHAYGKALTTFRELRKLDSSLLPIIWEAKALRLLGRLDDAITCLSEGLRTASPSEEAYRVAVAFWNIACYKSLKNKGLISDQIVTAIIEDLEISVKNEPGFKDSLRGSDIDPDLKGLIDNPIFAAWRNRVVGS